MIPTAEDILEKLNEYRIFLEPREEGYELIVKKRSD